MSVFEKMKVAVYRNVSYTVIWATDFVTLSSFKRWVDKVTFRPVLGTDVVVEIRHCNGEEDMLHEVQVCEMCTEKAAESGILESATMINWGDIKKINRKW